MKAYAAIEQLNDTDLDGNTIVVKAEPRVANRRQGGNNLTAANFGGNGGAIITAAATATVGGYRDNYNRRDSYGGGATTDNYNRRDDGDNYNRRDRDSNNDGNLQFRPLLDNPPG